MASGRSARLLAASIVVLILGNVIGLNVVGAASEEKPAGTAPPAQALLEVLQAATEAPTQVAPSVTTTAPAARRQVTIPSTTTTTTRSTAAATTSSGDYPFELTIDPLCVKAGMQITATAKLQPRGGIAMMAVYADGEPHETWRSAYGGDDGNVVYTWTAPSVPGDATLTAQAGDVDGGRTAVKRLSFRVVEGSASC